MYWWFKALNFQSALLLPTILYHIVFKLSRLRMNEKFNYFNYIICLSIGIIYFIYSEFIFSIPTLVITNDEHTKEILFFDNGRIITRILYNTIYLILIVRRLIRYRKYIINYSSDDSQNSLSWLYNILIVAVLLFPGPIFFYAISNVTTSLILGQVIPNFLFMFLNISLCYNIFSQNFSLVYEDIIEDESEKQSVNNKKDKDLFITKEIFEEYLKNI